MIFIFIGTFRSQVRLNSKTLELTSIYQNYFTFKFFNDFLIYQFYQKYTVHKLIWENIFRKKLLKIYLLYLSQEYFINLVPFHSKASTEVCRGSL